MKTSNEIKEFIVKSLSERNIIGLWSEIFDEIKETNNVTELKGINYRWAAACGELRKEKGWDFIDDTFCRSLICYNTTLNYKSRHVDERTRRIWKQSTGWDAEAIANGKHCELAKIIIEAFEKHVVNKEK